MKKVISFLLLISLLSLYSMIKVNAWNTYGNQARANIEQANQEIYNVFSKTGYFGIPNGSGHIYNLEGLRLNPALATGKKKDVPDVGVGKHFILYFSGIFSYFEGEG